jgi:hypothetical protein
MNWSRGLFRLWIVASMLWGIFGLIFLRVTEWSPRICYADWRRGGISPVLCEYLDGPRTEGIIRVWSEIDWSAVGLALILLLIPPITLLLMGLGARWILAGFRAKQQ